MTFTLNGTGTKYYGEREHDIGGTYITTKWIVILGVPRVPLSSWRVFPLNSAQFHDYQPVLNRDASETTQSFHVTPAPLNWRQIVNVYAVTLPLLALGIWVLSIAFARLGIHIKF